MNSYKTWACHLGEHGICMKGLCCCKCHREDKK